MSRPYIPQPGTIPFRAIAHLKTLARGETIATAPLAELLGTDSTTLLTTMGTAVLRGAVVRRKIDGRVQWSIGDGTPALPPDHEEDPPLKPLASRAIIEAAKAQVRAGAFGVVGVIQAPPPAAEPEPAPEPAPAPSGGVPFSFTWSSDGTMVLYKGFQRIQLSAEESAPLLTFAARMAT